MLPCDNQIHVLLRYFECAPGKTRDERVKETLETMGASILVGGATTFLAVVPLSASRVTIFMTVFNAFFAMVTLGVTHGLILLPVILSLVGPTTNVRHLESAREHPGIAITATCKTLGSGSFEENEEVDVDEIESMTNSVVQEVCETNDERAFCSAKTNEQSES